MTTEGQQPAAALDLDLDAIEARANAATPGPWAASDPHPMCGEIWVVTVSAPDGAVATGLDDSPNDAQFIAHAREDVPALIAEVRRLLAFAREAARLKEACEIARINANTLKRNLSSGRGWPEDVEILDEIIAEITAALDGAP